MMHSCNVIDENYHFIIVIVVAAIAMATYFDILMKRQVNCIMHDDELEEFEFTAFQFRLAVKWVGNILFDSSF